MDGYTILAGLLLFFLFFIYITWFGFTIKVENQKDEGQEIKRLALLAQRRHYNTGQVIDNNEFRADIYVKPARSINFITLTFVATRTGVSFDEVVGRA